MQSSLLKVMKRKIIQVILNFLTHLIIRKYRPKIIGITGSVGKTSAKEAIYLILSRYFPTSKSEKNLNTEIGLPLPFISGVEAKRSLFLWLANFLKGLKLILFRDKNYPHFVIVEMGADKPGDIKKLVALAKPKLAVMTAIGKVPVHVENYKDGIDQLIDEKAEIIKNLGKDDFAILNFDDEKIWPLREKTRAKVISFGFNSGADLRITDYQIKVKEAGKGFVLPDGVFFRIEHRGSVVPVWLKDSLGKPSAYAIAVAFAVGAVFDLNIIELGIAAAEFHQEKGRMRLIEGIENSLILDDSYNAAPLAMEKALETFQDLPGKRKIAVLGDMLELGQYAPELHEEVGAKAAGFCDLMFFVGQRMKFAYEKAVGVENGKDKSFWFENSKQVSAKLEPMIEPGDLILVKGSQGMRMEYVIEDVMAHPENAKDLLVRQAEEWSKQ